MKSRPMTDFGRRIIAGMAAAGIPTPAQLARDIDVSRQTVHRWLFQPVDHIDATTLFRLSDRLNMSGRWLITGAGNPNKTIQVAPNAARLLALYERLSPERRDRLLHCAFDIAKAL